jgi:arylsulfatase A-like enzyme
MNRHLSISIAIAIILTVALLPLTGCSGNDGPPNLLLITVDTLRPDHLGYHGYGRDTSPVIDRLAAGGVVFENNYSQSGWTLPSIATIFTGHYPKDHGATDFHWSIDVTMPTLAATLRKAGYTTHGYVSHVMLTPSYGIGDGFSNYDYTVLNSGHPHDIETSKALTDNVLAGTRNLKKPYFVWVHYFDPHFEYLPHPAYSRFGNGVVDRYDGEIAHTDHHIGRVLRHFDNDNTVVVFYADHGVEFGEHGGKYHYTLHNEVMRVPLAIKAPGLAPARRSDSVEQIDLLPTVLALLGQPPLENLPGRDLFSSTESTKPIFIERDRPPPWIQRGVIRGKYKLFVVELTDPESIPPASRGTEVPVKHVIPGVYMYDIEADPDEKNNIYSDSNDVALELLGLVSSHFSESRAKRETVELDDAMIKKLKSLGYIR